MYIVILPQITARGRAHSVITASQPAAWKASSAVLPQGANNDVLAIGSDTNDTSVLSAKDASLM